MTQKFVDLFAAALLLNPLLTPHGTQKMPENRAPGEKSNFIFHNSLAPEICWSQWLQQKGAGAGHMACVLCCFLRAVCSRPFPLPTARNQQNCYSLA